MPTLDNLRKAAEIFGCSTDDLVIKIGYTPAGAKIREYRERMGLSQKQLAAALGVDSSAVCLWENGKTAPTMKNLIRLAEVFGCSPGDLF